MVSYPTWMRTPSLIFLRQLVGGSYLEDCIRTPMFQRPYGWDDERERLLFDSILRGLPMGALTVLRTTLPLRFHEPEPTRFGFTDFILDGHQRLTALKVLLTTDKWLYDFESKALVLNGGDVGENCVPTKFFLKSADTFKAPPHLWHQVSRVADCVMDYPIAVVSLNSDDLEEIRDCMLRISLGGLAFTREDVDRLLQFKA